MGSNRLIEKGEFMYDTSYRIPMIIKQPGGRRREETCDEFVYLHDLFPTAIETSGEAPPAMSQSRSLWPLISGEENTTERDFVYSQFTAHFVELGQRMIRTRSHKFIFNSSTVGELYDLEKDPGELTNLIDNPGYLEVKKHLIGILYDEMKKTG